MVRVASHDPQCVAPQPATDRYLASLARAAPDRLKESPPPDDPANGRYSGLVRRWYARTQRRGASRSKVAGMRMNTASTAQDHRHRGHGALHSPY
jgi:hypothetical protein